VDRTPIHSEIISSIGYDRESKTLEVEFTSLAVYRYEGVPPQIFHDLLASDSRGKYFLEHVKGLFPFTRLSG
jgi:hypothetical protein